MSRRVPIAERLEGIIVRLRGAGGELRAGQTRQPRETLEDIRGDLEGVRLECLRLADACRGARPTLADGESRAEPMTLERAANLLDGPAT